MIRCCLLSWWLIALAPCFANAQTVYSVGIYAGGEVQEKAWLINSGPNQWGLSQYRRWEDRKGFVIINVGHEKELGGIQRRYTRVHLGSASFSVRLPACAVASIVGLLAVISVGLLGFGLKKATFNRATGQNIT